MKLEMLHALILECRIVIIVVSRVLMKARYFLHVVSSFRVSCSGIFHRGTVQEFFLKPEMAVCHPMSCFYKLLQEMQKNQQLINEKPH